MLVNIQLCLMTSFGFLLCVFVCLFNVTYHGDSKVQSPHKNLSELLHLWFNLEFLGILFSQTGQIIFLCESICLISFFVPINILLHCLQGSSVVLCTLYLCCLRLLLSWKIFPQVKHWLSDMMTWGNIKNKK